MASEDFGKTVRLGPPTPRTTPWRAEDIAAERAKDAAEGSTEDPIQMHNYYGRYHLERSPFRMG